MCTSALIDKLMTCAQITKNVLYRFNGEFLNIMVIKNAVNIVIWKAGVVV